MAYEKQNFLDGQIVTADHLNHMENGIIAAQNPRNLLDNSDFRNPVNQRGASSYTTAGAYGIDRWFLRTSSSVTVNSGSITVTGKMKQRLLSAAQGGTYTLAAGNADGSVTILTTHGWDNDASCYYVELHDGEYVWAALYEGAYTADTLPPYVPKGYGVELAECQRYYFVIPPGGAFIFRIRNQSTSAYGAYEICPSIVFPVPMRVVPTATLYYDVTDGSDEAKSPLSCTIRCCSMPNVVVPVNGWFDLNKVEASADL